MTVRPLTNQHGRAASCLGFTTDLDPTHPIYASDVIANAQPSALHIRQGDWEEVVQPSLRTAELLAPDSSMLVIRLTTDEVAAITRHRPAICTPNADCSWTNASVQLGAGSGYATLEILDGDKATLLLSTSADALRWKATMEHPLPAGVELN